MAKYWITKVTPYIVGGKKLKNLNPGTVVEESEVQYLQTGSYEIYRENFQYNCVNIKALQTPDLSDAEQFIIYNKYKQTNMCGEMCVCYSLGIPLIDLLKEWEVKKPNFFKQIFSGGKAHGTWYTDLIQMFDIQGKLADDLRLHITRYTPATLGDLQYPIVACTIDGNTGRLRGQGVGHWIVVRKTIPERTGYGFVEIYNPFPNRIEQYSWAEFVASAKTPSGVVRIG